MLMIKIYRKAIDSFFTGTVFLALGVVLLLGNLIDNIDPGYIIGKYWPTLLIFLGLKYIVFSLISTLRPGTEEDPEREETMFKLLHGYNPIGGVIWGVGLIIAGLILFLKLHHESNFWNLILIYWPILFIIGGFNGIVKCFSILFRYASLTRS